MDLTGKLIIKASLGEDIRRIPIHNEELTYDELILMMQRVFRGHLEANDDVTLKYKDEDGDLITLFDSADLAFAIQYSRVLKLTIFVNGKQVGGEAKSAGGPVQASVKAELRAMRDRLNKILDHISDESEGSASALQEADVSTAVLDTEAEIAEIKVNGKEFDPLQQQQSANDDVQSVSSHSSVGLQQQQPTPTPVQQQQQLPQAAVSQMPPQQQPQPPSTPNDQSKPPTAPGSAFQPPASQMQQQPQQYAMPRGPPQQIPQPGQAPPTQQGYYQPPQQTAAQPQQQPSVQQPRPAYPPTSAAAPPATSQPQSYTAGAYAPQQGYQPQQAAAPRQQQPWAPQGYAPQQQQQQAPTSQPAVSSANPPVGPPPMGAANPYAKSPGQGYMHPQQTQGYR